MLRENKLYKKYILSILEGEKNNVTCEMLIIENVGKSILYVHKILKSYRFKISLS